MGESGRGLEGSAPPRENSPETHEAVAVSLRAREPKPAPTPTPPPGVQVATPAAEEPVAAAAAAATPDVLWLEPKPSAYVAGVRLPPNFAWVHEGHRVAASGCPRRRAEVQGLGTVGIRLVVSCHERRLRGGQVLWPCLSFTFGMEQPPDLLADAEALSLELLHVACADGTSPDSEVLHATVSRAVAVVEAGGGVLFHCQSGVGRAGTCSAAYLLGTMRSTLQHTLNTLYAIPRPLYEFALSSRQTNALKTFYASYHLVLDPPDSDDEG
eukprot:Rhum_TRINITY_DN14826_c11_g1::Rhum_TRINITY_DN14826_c11_g1_i1::g.121099::m.121099